MIPRAGRNGANLENHCLAGVVWLRKRGLFRVSALTSLRRCLKHEFASRLFSPVPDPKQNKRGGVETQMLLALETAPAYSKIINRIYRQATGG